MFTRRRDEHFSESRKKAHARSFSFISKKLSKREGRRRKEGREGQRERERESFFIFFFFLRFFFTTQIALSSFSLSLFSLSFLSLSSSFFVCVFLLEFSPHEIELFWRRRLAKPSNHRLNLSSL